MANNTEKPFASELKALNRQVQKVLLEGEKSYFILNDLRNAYDDYEGRCSYCGLALVSTRYLIQTAHFAFHIPLEIGGAVSPKNLVPVCVRCRDKRRPRRPAEMAVFGYNAFSDLITQLAAAVYTQDQERISYFKVQIDHALGDYINTLYYKPHGLPEKTEVRIEGMSCLSDKITSLCKEIVDVLSESENKKEYKTARRISSSDKTTM